MRIQLFNPPVHHYSGVHYRMNPPLGLPILAAVLENAGHEAKVLDLEAVGASPDKLKAAMESQKDRWPDALGLTCTTHNARGCRESIAACREAGFDGYIAVGGPHATIYPDDPLLWGADGVVVGECEGNVVTIFAEQREGAIIGEPMPIEDIPGPLWTAHTPRPVDYYGNMPDVGKPESIAMWSRGCPHQCTFCGNPVFGRQRIRYRPPERVYEDMRELALLGVRAVFVYDDELVGAGGKQNQWLIDCCEQVEPLALKWKCQGRCSKKLQLDVLKAMYRGGCRVVMWGVESFHDDILAAMKKGTTEEDIWYTLRLARQAGLQNWVFLMVGNAEETGEHLAYTTKRMSEATQEGLVQHRQVTVCTPVAGTELYERAKREGWLVESPESGPQMAQVYNPTPWLSKREMQYWRRQLQETA